MEGIIFGLFTLLFLATIGVFLSLAVTVWGSHRRRLEEIEGAFSALKRTERWADPQTRLRRPLAMRPPGWGRGTLKRNLQKLANSALRAKSKTAM